MVVSDASIHNIMGGMESTAGVRLHNHRRKLKQRFDIIKKLGQGTYGKVQLGINKETGQEVAIKTIKKAKIETEADLVRIRREIQIMSSVQHPNIIHIYEVFENREKMVLVMEYAAGGELYDFLSEKKVLAEQEARRIFRQIATAVYYCHKHKICHRDLKLENILLDEHGSAKIADFGLSNVFNEQRLLNTFCGSPLYASPEIVKGTPYHGPEVDCWSLGVLLYTLVYGAMPFDGSNFKRLVKQISQGDYFEPKKPSSASPLIREMLTVTPARRANIEKICAHWWVNEGHTESCLDIAEELANQTPVRLDLLLSLAPPPPAVGSDMILTDEKAAGDSQTAHSDAVAPARCHSVGSLMDLDQPSAERKIQEFERHKQKGSAGDGAAALKDAPKRKLEEGISTEIVPSGAKKKEWCRRSNSQSRPASVVEEKSPEEKMEIDADVSEPQSSEASKAASESLSKNEESVKKDTQLVEGAACAPSEATSTESAEQKSPGAESSKASIGRDKTTRKSVKGSPKKSKPATASSTDNVPSSVKMSPNKEEELKGKTKVEEEVSVNNTEGPVAASSESSKEKTSEEISVSDAVKQKVKKKKKVTGSKSEETVTESVEKKVDSESSLIALNSKPEDSSSQEAKMELKKEATDAETNENTEAHSSKDSSVKTADTPKAGSVKAKKSRADLNLGKLGSSSEKSSGSEDLVSPTKTVERRRSKIFENSDQFNIFLKGSEQKPAENKPKKVFIPGVKVSDYKQAFERRSSVTPSSSQSPLKPSASKKAVDSSSGTAPCDLSPSEGTKSSEVPSSSTDSTLNSSAQILETSSKSQEENASSTETQSSKNIDQNSVEPSSNASKPEMNSTHNEATELAQPSKDEEAELELVPALQVTDKMSQQEKARIKKLKDAVDVISNAIAEETRKESGDALPVRKISTGKPPVPMSPEKSKSKGVASAKSPPVTPSEKKSMKIPTSPGAAAAEITENSGESSQKGVEATSEPESEKATPAKKKSAKVEITLKSATLPRRRTSKAEIQLGYPPSKIPESGPAGEYRTEVEHMVGSSNPARLQTQRSEVAFPVAAATNVQPLSFRSASLEPEGTPKAKGKPKEHIIPIRLESEREENRPQSLHQTPPPARPPVPPVQTQRSISQRSSSLSRQSTQDSDTDSTISASGPEPIRKSPREFIIPIAVEGGGYVTPRAGSLEPSLSEASTETSQQHRRSGRSSSRLRKMGSLLSDSEDEGFNSPFVTLQRHGSVTREGENLDDERPFHHMHRLRSSKPRRPTLEHNDSLSSAEEEDDDDDDGFEILTAESLFSTLLSRVRSLTQRLNVEDGGRSGFPSSRLMSHLSASGHSSPSSGFWSNVYGFPGEPLSRRVSENSQFPRPFGPNGEGPTPWRRSASRDTSDVDSVYSEADAGSLPRGSSRFDSGNLSDDPGFDNSSSCYYTPGLARRMQRPWRSSSQSLGYQSPLSQESTLSDSDWLMHHRKSSLGSLPTQSSNIPHQHSSRRLSRTLSLHSRTDDRRGKDVPSPHPVDYGRRMDYQPSTRRSLSMLESGIPIHSDSGDRVLPPLPSRDRRRDSSRSSMYARQRSADMSNSHYTQYSKSNDESASVRPHHSSSLPTMSRIKSKKSSDLSKTAEKIIREPKIPESESPITPTSRRVSSHRSLLDNGTAIDRTRIPSLTHLRSSSLARDGNKGTNYEETSSTVKKSSSTCSTSDRSILSKFLRQGSEEKDMSKGTEPADDNKDDTKKKRRISRFLRPDFYDTPREESEYAKKKDAKKAAETESKLKSKNSNKKLDSPPRVSVKNDSEIKAPSISEVPSQTKETESKLKSKTNGKKLANPPLVSVKNGTETKAPNISEVSSQSKETESKLKSKTSFKKLDSPPSVPVKVNSESQTSISEASPQTKEATNKLKSKTNIKKLDNPPLVPEKNSLEQEAKTVSDVSLQAKETETITKSKTIDEKFDNSVSVPENKVSESQTTIISENIAQNKESSFVPVAVDKNAVSEQAKKEVKVAKKQNGKQVKAMDESKQNSNVKNGDKKSEANSPVFEKQPSNKNRFLLSLERKLEKFRSSGDDIPSTVNNGKSRVDKAIRSLREQSLSNQGSNITESNLLKRAVSVDDLDSTPKESCGSKIGSKVTSVLGLFKKMEDVPAKTSQSPPKTSVLSRLRRTQSVYAGSQSDSVLVGNANDSNNSTPVPPLRLKKTNSNSSVKNNSINITKKDSTITPKTMTTNKENLCSKDSSRNSEKLSGFSNSETALSNLGQGVTTLLRKGSVKLKAKSKQEADNINHSEPSLATNHVSGIGIKELVIAGSTLKPERPASFCAPLQDSVSAVTPREKEGLLTFNHPRPNSTVISLAPYIEGSNERPVNSTESPVSVSESRISSKICETIRDENVGINEQLANEKEMISMNADVNTITNGDIPLSNDSNQLSNDDYTLNDDEVKFANVKRVDSCGDECSVVSPADELESLDSWSICSDFDGREFPTSPIPPLGDEVEESVVDRIRRKSFYSRFNDIKKKRKSSLSSLSSPYRDPNSLSSLLYQQSVPRKKEHHHHHHHHSSHHEKPSRSQSFYDYDSRFTTFNRKSPLPLRSQTSYQGDLSSNSLGTENDNHDMNGYVESTRELRDENLRGEAPSNVHCLGGSMETLRMPRHFNSKINLGTPSYHVPTYSGPVRRASDSHLSRSMESSVGSIIPRSQLPISTSRYSSTLISPSDSMMRMGDTLPMHGKYTRYKSPNPLDSPPMFHIGSLTPDEEYERPITPH